MRTWPVLLLPLALLVLAWGWFGVHEAIAFWQLTGDYSWYSLSQAFTFEYADGKKVEGEIVQGKADALKIRVGDNTYEDIPWEKLSQATLKQLAADPKLKLEPFVQPFIEIPEDERIKKTEVELKPVPRLEKPAKGSLLGAMFGSSVGQYREGSPLARTSASC